MAADSTGPTVSVIIVTYNSAEVIRDCLAGLGGLDEVIVIDNASADNTVELVREEFPAVTVMLNPDNDGFSRAVNKAAAASHGSHIMLLNPDALIDAATITALARLVAADPSIGAAAPLLKHEGTGVHVIAAGHVPSIWRMFLHQTGLSRLGTRHAFFEGHYLFESSFGTAVRDVDWMSGGCVIVPADVWRSEGGLSDRWFMYAEDVEFCLRIKARGLRVVVAPALTANHAVGGSSSNVDGRVNTAWITNLYDLYSWRLAPTALQPVLWKGVVMAGMVGRSLIYRASSARSNADPAATRQQLRRYAIYLRALLAAPKAPKREQLHARWARAASSESPERELAAQNGGL